MWKYITRGLRTSFERGTWPNLTSTAATDQSKGNLPSTEKKSPPGPFRFVPCLLETCQRHLSQFSIQRSSNDEQQHGKDKSSSDKNKAGESFHSKSVHHQPCAILGAFGWSGVLVLGWTILQPWYRHTEQRKPLASPEVSSNSIDKRYICLYKLLLNPALSQPINNHVLPSRAIAKPLPSSSAALQQTPELSPTSSESSSKTIEEAFDEAAEEVRKVHEHAIGEAENRLGVACLSSQKSDKAVLHFRNALALNHAPAAFNLGQCHELGIGTKQDFVQAAEYYKIASDMGHATATYNLGVFYAHGWGGLTSDVSKAKHLFLTAAALGQPEARYALKLETKFKADINQASKQPTDSFESRIAFDLFKSDNITLHFTSKPPSSDYVERFDNIRRPESSLPSSPTSSVASSTPSSTSLIHPLILDQDIISDDEYSNASSEDEWQNAIELATINGNSATLYRLAVCYENSPTADQELILHLYRLAADHGHQEAKIHLKILEEYYALGILDDYLKSNKHKSKSSSFANCSFQN